MKQPAFLRIGVTVGLLFSASVESRGQSPKKDNQPAPKFSAEQLAFYEKQVLPVLKARCYECHGAGKIKGDLQLTSRSAILERGDLDPAVNLAKPEQSLLLKAVLYKDSKLEMPPTGKLPANEIDVLVRWVNAGLPMPAGSPAKVAPPKNKGGVVTEESKNYWAYKPVKRPDVPQVKNKGWVKSPIDAFILAKLEAKGLSPVGAADRIALIRRATYDLTGLPPSPEEIDKFVGDASPKAYENLIERLLASPQYGEKWGRHWLDVVHFAETNGYERDGPKPFAWRFRDYVIKSFNQDKPFDRFIKEQLAGDELDPNNPDAVIATGYYRLGIWDDEPADHLQAQFDEYDDWVATTSQVFLGMTMNCARCHDHKIDPIPQTDYYRLVSFFRDVQRYSNNMDSRNSTTISDVSPPELRKTYEAELKKRDGQKAELQKQMTKIENEVIKKMPAEDQRASEGPGRPGVLRKLNKFMTAEQSAEYTNLRVEFQKLAKIPEPPNREAALSVNHCIVRPAQTFVQIRGNAHAPGTKVEPGFPQVLSFPDPKIADPAKDAKSSGRRSVLASWIASKDNQLTARVIANRIWQHHFGRGIVASANDFGKFGTGPTHPELLDWLASEFINPTIGDVSKPWTFKRMHKLILLSNAYQMSSKADEKALKEDPGNMLFWRFNMRRLTAEEVRDSILSASGKLNLKMGGPSVYPPIPREVLQGQSVPGSGWGKSSVEEASRRSVYVHIKRSLLVPVLSQHDQADTDSSCPVRYTTTVPTQALGMLNGEFTNEQATAFAERLVKDANGGLQAQVTRALRLATGRVPTADEVKKDVAFIESMQAKYKLDAAQALRQYCLLVLNLNEFVYLD
jgi:hypothetical protein